MFYNNKNDANVKVLFVSDVGQILHIGKDKAYKLFKQPSFPSIRFENRYMVRADDFDIWLNNIKKIPGRNYKLS